MNSYWFAARPREVDHRYPYLVFDCQDRLHYPLTVFAKKVSAHLIPKTAQTYLYSITPFFSYLDTDVWQVRAGMTWDSPPQKVRQAVEDYLVQKLQCLVRPHRQGWKYVTITAGTRSTLSVFLSALKLFYRVMCQHGTYTFPNPMVDTMSAKVSAVLAHLDDDDEQAPPMPSVSGVGKRRPKPAQRLTDSYYKLENEEWVPQIVDDPELLARILHGGERLPLKYTRQRDEVVTWLLFETGARVSEVTGLMLGDWAALGTHTKAQVFNKGGYGRRTKRLSFAANTVILLKRYFDGERLRFDPNGYTLEDYLLLAKRKQIDLEKIPLFMTTQGTQLTPKEYREHYWNPACQAAEPPIVADVHQARHWHVTLAVRDVYMTAQSKGEIERRLRGLVEYMHWKNEEMLEVYQHYFDDQLYDDRREEMLKHVHGEVQQYLEERRSGKRGQYGPPADKKAGGVTEAGQPLEVQLDDEPNMGFIFSLGGN